MVLSKPQEALLGKHIGEVPSILRVFVVQYRIPQPFISQASPILTCKHFIQNSTYHDAGYRRDGPYSNHQGPGQIQNLLLDAERPSWTHGDASLDPLCKAALMLFITPLFTTSRFTPVVHNLPLHVTPYLTQAFTVTIVSSYNPPYLPHS